MLSVIGARRSSARSRAQTSRRNKKNPSTRISLPMITWWGFYFLYVGLWYAWGGPRKKVAKYKKVFSHPTRASVYPSASLLSARPACAWWRYTHPTSPSFQIEKFQRENLYRRKTIRHNTKCGARVHATTRPCVPWSDSHSISNSFTAAERLL